MSDLVCVILQGGMGTKNTIELISRDAQLTTTVCKYFPRIHNQNYNRLLEYFNEGLRTDECFDAAIEFFVSYKCYDKLEEFSQYAMNIIVYSIIYRDIFLFNKWIQLVSVQDVEAHKTGYENLDNLLEYVLLVFESANKCYNRKKGDIRYRDYDDPTDCFIKAVLTKIGMKTQNLITDEVRRIAKIKDIENLISVYKGMYLCDICGTIDKYDKLVDFWGCKCQSDDWGHAWDPWALAIGPYHLECITDESIKKCKDCGGDLPIHDAF